MTAEVNNVMLDKTKQVTLEYLTTPYYHNILTSRKKNALNEVNDTLHVASSEDISFYRKRIVATTKEMLKGNETPLPNADMKTHYDNYVRSMIDYFKMLDRKDIIQDQYKNIIEENEEEDKANNLCNNDVKTMNEIDITNIKLEKADELIMKKTIKIANLDDFVTITTNNENEKQIIPVKKEIDLKLTILKTKGIKKKTNKKDK